jgi:hypothetical protein
MSELSSVVYKKKMGVLIDHGTYDPDQLFVELIKHHFKSDPNSDFFHDTQDDMEEIFDAMGSLLATNYSSESHGSPNETKNAKQFRKVRNWVESVEYDSNNRLKQAQKATNQSKKFGNKMDSVMHMLGGAQVGTYIGESISDGVSFGIEVVDQVKAGVKHTQNAVNNLLGKPPAHGLIVGYDSVDFNWGKRGSFLQNAFDTSEANARTLARKFINGQYSLSKYTAWYNIPHDILYR